MQLDLTRWLPEFPVRDRCLYLDHAALSPLPRPVAAVMRERISQRETGGRLDEEVWLQQEMTCRHLGAGLTGASPEDVSLVGSTSLGLGMVAQGLEWHEGDEVVVGDEEFAANVAPWLALERRGVAVRRFPQPGGRIRIEDVAAVIGPATRIVAVSWVSFHTGWVAPLAQLGALCQENGAFLVVDAVQGLGILPMDMRALGVDALVAGAHTWLLGPQGIALLITRPVFRSQLRPALAGWRNVELPPGDQFLEELHAPVDGRRFEPGTVDGVAVAGLAEALDLLVQVGPEVVQARVEMLVRQLMRILIAHGWEVLSPGPGHPVAGIVAARHPRVEPEEAVRRLAERHIVCAVREGLVRFSPHFYTTRGELEALDRILEKLGL